MVKLGPDLYTGSDSYSGYQSTGSFIGFSLLHESGTGGAPKYGVVSQMPAVGTVDNPLEDQSVNRSTADVSRLGYYKSSLSNDVTVELGATAKAGLYQYQFSGNAAASNIIVDVSHVLPSFRGQGLGQNYLGGNISVTKSDSGVRYTGSGSYDNVRLDFFANIGWIEWMELTISRGGTVRQAGQYISAVISIKKRHSRHSSEMILAAMTYKIIAQRPRKILSPG